MSNDQGPPRPHVRLAGEGHDIAAGDERDDWDYCLRSLLEVSRTFSRPIAMLPHDLEVAVTCGYLLCRIADTIEDHPALPLQARDDLFARMLDVLEHGADPRTLTAGLSAVAHDDVELSLARNLPRVMRVFGELGKSAQEACRRWIPEMIRGMQLYAHRKPGSDHLLVLHTIDDLGRYCYFVAGTVGHLLTDLFGARSPEAFCGQRLRLMREHAEHFGAGLQLVNILKDITEDRERGVSFIPESVCAAQGLRASELLDLEQRTRAHAAVQPVFELARRRLRDAFEYSLAVPREQTGVRMFCLVPLFMAVRTLVLGEGNDALFIPGEQVKISRAEVAGLIARCTRDAGDDAALRSTFVRLWQSGVTSEAAQADGLDAASSRLGAPLPQEQIPSTIGPERP